MGKRKIPLVFITIFLLLLFTAPIIADNEKININTATEKELCTLIQVGPKKAGKIVQYREKHGDFKTPEDIKHVKGISDKIFKKNESIIIVKDIPIVKNQ
ncbi:MAG: hypothetical protein B6I26_02480 [Desulfobacteraceae bacterium 4572_130]|nr:MAG: hypothetical protein B6I26_02480 [Desulfobacteraceae bacterium 4572_130]